MHEIGYFTRQYEVEVNGDMAIGFEKIPVFECDLCGCAVSDPDLHMDKVHPEAPTEPRREYDGDSVTDFMHPSAPEPTRHWDIGDLS